MLCSDNVSWSSSSVGELSWFSHGSDDRRHGVILFTILDGLLEVASIDWASHICCVVQCLIQSSSDVIGVTDAWSRSWVLHLEGWNFR